MNFNLLFVSAGTRRLTAFIFWTAVAISGPLGAAEIVSSPYQGRMTAEEIAAAKTSRPPIENTRWVHEAALVAYEAQIRLGSIEAEIAAARSQIQALVFQRRKEGVTAEAEAELQRSIQQFEEQADQQRAQLERYVRNIPKLQGVYFRPAIEAELARGNYSPENPFAKLLSGGRLEGISLTDDQKAFAHGLAWRNLGGLAERGVFYAFRPWWIEQRSGEPELNIDHPQAEQAFASFSKAEGFETLRRADLALLAASITPRYTMSGTLAYLPETKHPDANQFGAWHVSIELMRSAIEGADPEQVDFARQLSQAAGLTAELGPLVQYPRLHFQARLDDVLLADTEILVLVYRVGHPPTQLASNAQVEMRAADAPAMVTSYASQRVHASLVPTAADWALIRAPETRSLAFMVPLMREDGIPDYVTLPMSLTGFPEALQQLESAQRTTFPALAALNRRYDQLIAAAQPRFEATAARLAAAQQERARELAALEREVRAYLQAQRPEAGLPVYPSVLSKGASNAQIRAFNQRLTAAFDDRDRWQAGYRQARAELYDFSFRFYRFDVQRSEALGGQLQARLDAWQRLADQQREKSNEINRQIEQLNAASIARESRRDATQREVRRRPVADEPSAAEKYYRDQQKPYVPYFRDTPPPPRPTHYIGQGYY